MHSHVRRTLFTAVKFALAVAILAYLVFMGRDAIANLSAQTIEWPMMAAALVFTLLMAALSYLRWHILIRALGIEARLVDSMRLGALGFALNFVALGSIGGDFFKAIFLAHGHPGRRTEAIATVVADRIVGLLTMLLLASTGILMNGLLDSVSPTLKILCLTILLVTAIGWAGFILMVLVGGLSGPRVCGWVETLPGAGKIIARLLATMQVYRSQKWMLLTAIVVSVGMALCYVSSYYLVARALPIHEPSWSEHLMIVPTAGVAGTIPITPNGFGTTEAAIEWLYENVPRAAEVVNGDGMLVGLGRRPTDIVVAAIGLLFYLSHRREVRAVYAEVEEIKETGLVE